MLQNENKIFRFILIIIFIVIVTITILLGIHFYNSPDKILNTTNIKSELILATVAFLLISATFIFFVIWRVIEINFTKKELQNIEIIKRLNRVYRVLSNINQVIVRIKNKEKLLKEVCKIVIEDGGYSLCWVEIFNKEKDSIEPIIICGPKNDFLNELRLRLGDNYIEEKLEYLKNSKPIICNNILEIDSYGTDFYSTESWKNIVKSFGLMSYAVFPILDEEKIIGAINFYSDKPNYFNEEETKLLEELSMDLSYALKHFEDEEKRKEAEKELRESHQMLKLILDTIPVRVFWKDLNLNYLGCNKTFANDAGFKSADEIIGKNDYEMAWRDQAEIYRSDDKFVIESKQPKLNYEEPQTSSEGKKLWLRTSKIPLIDSEGNIKGILGTYEDITERKLIEEALKISESELRTTLYSIGDGVIAVDANGFVTIMNPVAELLTGWKEEEAKGKPLEEVFIIINEETRNKVENPVRRVLREGVVIGLANHTVLISKDGKEYPIADSGAPIFDSKKNITGVVLVFRDQTEERRILKAIQESEEKFRKLSESALAGVYLIQDNVFKYVNPSLAKVFGYEVEEIIDKLSPFDLTFYEDRIIVQENIRKRIEGISKDIRYEFRGLKKNGEIIFVEVHGVLINYKNKPAIIGTLIDITERKRAEEALRQAEENFRRTFDESPIGIRIVDIDGKTIYTNKALLDIYGFENLEEFINTSVTERYTSESYEEFKKRRELRRQGIETPNYEISIIRKNGEVRNLQVYRKEIVWNNQKLYQVNYIDITERRKAEKALRESEERLNLAIQSANIGLWDQNFITGKIIRNKQWAEMLGYELEEIESDINAFMNLVHPDDIEVVKEKIKEHESGDTDIFSVECRMLTKNKDWKWILNIGKIVERDSEGKPLRAIGVHLDIDKQKKAEEILREAKEKAEQADKIKTEFLAQVSHEIRTPINIIVSSANLIKDSVYDLIESEYRQLFSSIDSASYRITRTIDQILNMSELQVGAFQPNYKLINLKDDILENLYHEYKNYAENKGLNIFRKYLSNEPHIIADEYCVTQIFANLLDNAIKYTQEGYVEIVLSENHNKEIIVEVKDTGIGISEEFLPRLFEPFVQEEQGYSRPYEGNGLGLALVKKYCELNKASISVESRKGVGTIFKVVFHK